MEKNKEREHLVKAVEKFGEFPGLIGPLKSVFLSTLYYLDRLEARCDYLEQRIKDIIPPDPMTGV
jgi:hypothetical protein